MVLTRLPTELLDNIITHALPEGLESVALTCRRIYALCTRFIEHHNRLRSQFQTFTYLSSTIRTAFDLIISIAVEPVVARYVRDADFEIDSLSTRGRPRLDWKRYYDEIEGDLKVSRYSQHAAAFLLTLLPNVKVLTPPTLWKPLDAPDKLIDAVVRKAKQSHLPCDRPSLAQITRFEPYVSLVPLARYDLNWASPFLALPHVCSFRGHSCVVMDDAHKSIASKELYPNLGEPLEAVSFVSCCIDEVGIADFLKHTPRLRTLSYSHSTKHNFSLQCWDMCKFVTAIEREVGSHLEELSVSTRESFGSIAPGKASMRGFSRLQRLEFSLELGRGSSHRELDFGERFIGDIVPASVSLLSLISAGTDHHDKALDLMFHHFAATKDSQLPALKDIYLTCPNSAAKMYKDQCARLLAETEKVGVVLHLMPWASSIADMGW